VTPVTLLRQDPCKPITVPVTFLLEASAPWGAGERRETDRLLDIGSQVLEPGIASFLQPAPDSRQSMLGEMVVPVRRVGVGIEETEGTRNWR
jgi:hypothetical protein